MKNAERDGTHSDVYDIAPCQRAVRTLSLFAGGSSGAGGVVHDGGGDGGGGAGGYEHTHHVVNA